MADDAGTQFLSYFSVCARARASKERNERMRQKADLLDSIFKPINTERLDMLKTNYMATVTNKKGKSIRHSKAIRLSISSSSEEDDDTHHSTSLSVSDDSYQSSMEDQNEEKSTREEVASPLPPNSTFYPSLHQQCMSFPSIPLLTLPQAAASIPSTSLPLTMSPDISLESFTASSSTPILTPIMAPIYTAAAPVSTSVTSSVAPLVSTITPISTVVPPTSTLFNATPSITLASAPTSAMSIQTSTEDTVAPMPLVSTATAASTSFISVAPPVASNVSVSMASNVNRASPSQSSSLSSLLDQPVDVKQQPQDLIVSSSSPSSVSSIEGHHSVEQFTYENKDTSNGNNELLDVSNGHKGSKEKEEDADKSSLSSESDFWETPSTAPVIDRLHTHTTDTVDDKTVSPNVGITATDNINPTTNTCSSPAPPDAAKQHKSSLQSHSGSTSSVDYHPKNATMAAFSLLHTLNAQLRRDHKLSKTLYQTSTTINMQSSIQHSSVLNSLLTRRAELGKDMTTWDSGTLSSVLMTSLDEVVAQHGPPVLKTDDKMLQKAGTDDDDDEGWSTLLPLLLEHVRLLFQCGTLLEKVAQVYSPVLQIEKNKLLTFFERECGAEEIFSLTPSSISSLSQENEAEVNKKQSAYHSLLQSSVHSDVSDSLSEDSAVLALQLKRDTNTKPFGGINVMKGFGGEVGEEKDEFDGSLPLPSSPPSHAPRPRYTEPHTSSNQENTSGTTEKLNQSTLQKRMGQHEVDVIVSSPLSGPSVDDNDDDDFDFYN